MLRLFRGLQLVFLAAKKFLVTWFLPLPAIDSFEDEDTGAETSSPAASSPAGEEMPLIESHGSVEENEGPSVPAEPEAAPEVRAPEGAEERVARDPGQANPFA